MLCIWAFFDLLKKTVELEGVIEGTFKPLPEIEDLDLLVDAMGDRLEEYLEFFCWHFVLLV